MLAERGARRDVLEFLTGGRVASIGALVKKTPAARAALAALQDEGLITVTTPLKGAADASRTVRVARLTAQGSEDLDASLRLGARQLQALDFLRAAPDGIALADLADEDIPAESVERLAAIGLVTIERRRVERDPFESPHDARLDSAPGTRRRSVAVAADPWSLTLTAEQQSAFDTLAARAAVGRFHAALLHGVTGSGKTQIYLRLARAVRDSGRGVLMMVPEIALTPAAASIFRAAFGDRVAIQHSALSEGERYDQWQRIRRGEVDVVIGTRSSVFVPLARIGLIVVDEEHDGSYKQESAPRYNGRDVAVVRGRASSALVVLGSATPSLETSSNAEAGRYERIVLTRRVLDRPMAHVTIVDMRAEYASEGPDVILSAPLRDAMAARPERGEQAIAALLARFAARDLDVLVGTQMIAKGHDFPSVTLVGVISADVGLGLADFRAAERTFQLLTQVAGRAGRGEIAGEAVVQTLYPDHYSIRHACRQDYAAFYGDEMHFRRSMRYPPAVALINVVVKARTRQAAMEDAGTIAQALRSPGGDAPGRRSP